MAARRYYNASASLADLPRRAKAGSPKMQVPSSQKAAGTGMTTALAVKLVVAVQSSISAGASAAIAGSKLPAENEKASAGATSGDCDTVALESWDNGIRCANGYGVCPPTR